ncbi:PREDICTED: enhancer of split malpha protein-like [Nicrophorus vespilloides]|uniref:Enhancer of split malpha protein-like n=1 Tax=Nicrophorus vespilloides TaxID=110193 RepID=A0ABM1M767_NICVS|nr:PREDICTED: enhancer of split malpha protein-like [Nicrophorus vespilloides]
MSSYNDYIVASNNSVNENYVNAKKARSTKYQIKQLLKPIISIIKKDKKNTYKKSPQPEYFDDCEIENNLANEMLESRIMEEIDSCDEFSAVPIYDSNGSMDVIPVHRGQKYIPVHFAKTEAGTFFWTSVSGADSDISCHGDKNAITGNQTPEMQVPCDRWAQA